MAEVGVDLAGGRPTQLTDQLQQTARLVVTVGGDADVPEVPGPNYETWDIDEPSRRGIDGLDRMRLVRDHIDHPIHALAYQLFPDITDTDPPQLKLPGRVAHENRLVGDAE